MKGDLVVGGWHSVAMSLKKRPDLCKEMWLLSGEATGTFKGLKTTIESAGIKPQFVDRNTLRKIYGSDSHHGVVLRRGLPQIKKIKEWLECLKSTVNKVPLVLVLDRVQDPRNFGACLRVAACAGVDAVVYPNSNSASITNVVAQAASGAIDLVTLIRVSNLASALRQLSGAGIWLVGSAEEGNHDLYEVDFCLPTAIIVGNEGFGMRGLTKSLCDMTVCLPTKTSLSSLNVSSAAAVIIYEALRQRTVK